MKAALFCATLLMAAPAVAHADACDKLKDAEAFNACLATEGPAARVVESDLAAQKKGAPINKTAPINKNAPMKKSPPRAAAPRPRTARNHGRVRMVISPGD